MSELYRFGLDPGKAPDADQWRRLMRFIEALLNNPQLHIGDRNSEIHHPPPVQIARPRKPGSAPGSSSSGSGSSDSSNSSGASEPSSSGSDSSDDSSDSSSSSSDGCCPEVVINAVQVAYIGAEAGNINEWVNTAICYNNAFDPEPTAVRVDWTVTPPPPGACDAYRGKLHLRVLVAGVPAVTYLGLAMGDSQSSLVVINGRACQEVTVTACIEVFGAPLLEEISGCCAPPVTIQLPPVCGEEGCGSSSSSSSGSGS